GFFRTASRGREGAQHLTRLAGRATLCGHLRIDGLRQRAAEHPHLRWQSRARVGTRANAKRQGKDNPPPPHEHLLPYALLSFETRDCERSFRLPPRSSRIRTTAPIGAVLEALSGTFGPFYGLCHHCDGCPSSFSRK